MSFKNFDRRNEDERFSSRIENREHPMKQQELEHRAKIEAENQSRLEEFDMRHMREMQNSKRGMSKQHNNLSLEMKSSSSRTSNSSRTRNLDNGMGLYGSGLTARDLLEISSILNSRTDKSTMRENREKQAAMDMETHSFPRPKEHSSNHMMNDSDDMMSNKSSSSTSRNKSSSSSSSKTTKKTSSRAKTETSSSRTKPTSSARVPRVESKKEKKTR